MENTVETNEMNVIRPANEPGISRATAGTITAAHEVLDGTSKKKGLMRLLPFMGPAFIAAVAYIDPGNYATNIQSGAKYGYMLLWVVVASNLMAMLVQTMAAKLGIASGRNLAEMMRDHYPHWARYAMWILMELVAMATDLAEFLGAALGVYLLFPGLFNGLAALTGLPNLLVPAFLMGLLTLVVLLLEHGGFRPLEALISGLVGIVSVCFLLETILDQPQWGAVLYHSVVPAFNGADSVLLATGILGATVMPHVIFLHSGLTQNRIVVQDVQQRRRLFHFEVIDVIIAMSIAGLINAAMLVMAAATFHFNGLSNIGSIEEAYRTLTPLLGGSAGLVFAISLLASGHSSSTVGTMAGQMVMQGFIHRKVPLLLRRLLTMAPAFIVIAMRLDPTQTLVLSQVVLSFGLPFAIIPLVIFTSRRSIMGELTNRRVTTVAASLVAGLIVALNLFLLYQTFFVGG
jgi:manganese transport protein